MKKISKVLLIVIMILVVVGCSENNSSESGNSVTSKVLNSNTLESETDTTVDTIEDGYTAEMALEGVTNYCQETYGYNQTSSSMYLTMGEESENEYQVIFRSYTGAYVYFYIDKTTGATRMVETVPDLGVEEETGVINLNDYLNK